MKYLILCTLFFGAAYAAEEAVYPVDIDIESRGLNLTDTISAINVALGQITGNFASINQTALNQILAPLVGGGTAVAVVAGLSALKTALLGLLTAPLAIANGILSIIGLVLLIVFLVEGGDFLSLVGFPSEELPTFRSFSSWSFSDIINNRMLNNLSDMVYKAIEKYD